MRISDWSSDVCSSDLEHPRAGAKVKDVAERRSACGQPVEHREAARRRRMLPRAERTSRFDQKGGAARGCAVGMSAGVDMEPPLGDRLKPCQIGRHTSELQSLMRISYAVFCLQQKNTNVSHNRTSKL